MAQAVKPAEPRFISAFFWETLPYPQPYLDSASGGPRYLKQQNPVHLLVLHHSVRDDRNRTAGLVANAEDYTWSSAARKAEMNLISAQQA